LLGFQTPDISFDTLSGFGKRGGGVAKEGDVGSTPRLMELPKRILLS